MRDGSELVRICKGLLLNKVLVEWGGLEMRVVFLSFCFMILSGASLAQQSLQCQILREQILKQININDQCVIEWQSCVRGAADFYERNNCDARRHGCQIGNALFQRWPKEKLDAEITNYKDRCER
jgi:hypothetical protein